MTLRPYSLQLKGPTQQPTQQPSSWKKCEFIVGWGSVLEEMKRNFNFNYFPPIPPYYLTNKKLFKNIEKWYNTEDSARSSLFTLFLHINLGKQFCPLNTWMSTNQHPPAIEGVDQSAIYTWRQLSDLVAIDPGQYRLIWVLSLI